MAKRQSLTKSQRLDVFHAASGLCHICGMEINLARERFEVEHVIALGLGGTDDPSNWRPAHPVCHAAKSKADVTRIAKAKRVKAKHEGAFRPARHKLPGGKGAAFKKKLNGAVVSRDTGEVIKEGRH